MAKINALASFIALIQGNREATLSQAGEAFASDFGHFARANNREPLNMAVKTLGKHAKDKAIGEAINAGYTAGALVTGYIGAQSGKFADQPDTVKATFEDAITRAALAFNESLQTSEAFAERAPKTAADKATAKAEKDAKQLEAVEALITAKVQAGELVRARDVAPFPQAEMDAMKATIEALQLENAALLVEVATLRTVTAKPAKAKALQAA